MSKKLSLDRGDIIHLDLDPTKGSEQRGKRYALVLSPQIFNNLGLALVAPITTGGSYARNNGFAVSLFDTLISGVILTNQIRTIDIKERVSNFIEKCPSDIVNDVLAKVQTLIEIE